MLTGEPQAPRALLRSLVQASLQSSVPVESIFAGQGLSLAALYDSDEAVPLVQFEAIAEQMLAACPQQDFALRMGQLFSFEAMPGLGNYVLSGQHLQQVLEDFSQYKYLILPVLDIRLAMTPQSDKLYYASNDHTPVSSKPYYPVALFSAIAKFADNLLAQRGLISHVAFVQPQPLNWSTCGPDYRAVFGCEPAFNAPQDVMCFKAGTLQRPLPGASEALHQGAQQAVMAELAQHKQRQGLEGQVLQLMTAKVLEQGGPEDCQLDLIAAELGINGRTLQRRLQQQETSFAALKDLCLRQLAEQWLCQQRSLDAIAEALGFSERTAFSRAFKRWTGLTPSDYKKRHLS